MNTNPVEATPFEPVQTTQEEQREKRKRIVRPYPQTSFEEALELGLAIHKFSSGNPIRRLTLFDQLGKAPESGPSKQMIYLSSKYGITNGSSTSDLIELTADGKIATCDEVGQREKKRAQIKLAIQSNPILNGLYTKFINNKLPTKAVLNDAAKEIDSNLSDEMAEEVTDIFIVNLKYVGLLQALSGADRIVTIDHLLDSLPPNSDEISTARSNPIVSIIPKSTSDVNEDTSTNICFYITPIGDVGSDIRKHSDLFLGSIVEPALEPLKLKVVRADKIDKPGIITKQIIDMILNAKLVIADLSFHNPNAFYELAIRHAARKPVVQIIRKIDKIPFDVSQSRTIQIDSSDIYTFVPKIESYKAEISNQARRALENPDIADNLLSLFYPNSIVN